MQLESCILVFAVSYFILVYVVIPQFVMSYYYISSFISVFLYKRPDAEYISE